MLLSIVFRSTLVRNGGLRRGPDRVPKLVGSVHLTLASSTKSQRTAGPSSGPATGVDFVDTPVSDDQDPPELSTVEFKANGSGTLYHKFASMDELSVAAGATTMPRVIIGTALSSPPEFGRSIPISDTLPELGYTDSVTAGWYPVRTLVINKWDVPGGFTYVD